MIENIDGSCWLISLLNTLFKVKKIEKMINIDNIEDKDLKKYIKDIKNNKEINILEFKRTLNKISKKFKITKG